MKKIISSVIASVMLAASVLTGTVPQKTEIASADSSINYAEALQKTLYFYECQQAGPLPDWNRVEWRGDSTMDDFITGGWYDAGDHVKFNLPMAYSASMIAWGLYQYPDGIEKCGEMTNYVNNLTFALDYFAACDLGDEVIYQVGNGQDDHSWWGPAELVEYGMKDQNISNERPYYSGRKCSAALGEMAAALAAGYCALQGKSDKIDSYLEHAKNIFAIADAEQSDDEYMASDAKNFYRSSHFYDELFWAANWLYKATGDKIYLDKATGYIPNLSTELGTSELKYSWGQCWDDVQQGGMILYAQNTNDSTYINQVKKHLDYWTYNVKKLDGGLRWLTDWGCLRHATAAAFTAAVACDTLPLGNTSAYKEFYEEQANYCLGANPDNRAYVVGYGENSPLNVHHRSAHSSWKNALDTPVNNRHILYGALVGGPTSEGVYEDDRQNHINNEVACDYNAGFTGLMAKMVSEYGGSTDPNFPEPEQRETEFYVEAKLKHSATGSDLSLKFTNHTAWPPRIVDNMSYRYYLDATEIINAGFNPEDIVVRVDRDQALMYGEEYAAKISPITHYQDNIYYIQVTYPDGRAVMPISEGRNQCETMLALVFPNYQTGWDAANDYSNSDLLDLKENESVITDKITVYENGVLIYGIEPDGTTPSTTENPDISKIKGDTNLNGTIETADLVLLNKHLIKETVLKEQALLNADVNDDNKLNIFDAILLKRMLIM